MNASVGIYSKSIVMMIAAGIGILAAALSDNHVSAVELVNITLAIFGAALVYFIPNLPSGAQAYAKSIVALGVAAGSALIPIVTVAGSFGHVSTGDWLNVLLAGLSAIGVYVLPNASPAKAIA